MPICENLVSALLRLNFIEDKGITFVNGSEEEEFLSYAELNRQASINTAKLKRVGVFKGTIVIIAVEDSRKFIINFWACLLIGAIPVPLSMGMNEWHRKKWLSIWSVCNFPKFFCSNKKDVENLFTYAEEIGHRDIEILKCSWISDDTIGEEVQPIVIPSKSEVAYIQFSSGSTAIPKGVMLTHGNLMANTTDIIDRAAINSIDAMLSWMPLSHDMGIICFHLSALVAGINQFIIPTPLFIRRPSIWLAKLSEHAISISFSPNFGLHYLLESIRGKDFSWNLSSVRLIFNGAEPIIKSTVNRFIDELHQYQFSPTAIYPGYGLAEGSVAVSLPIPGSEIQPLKLDRNFLGIGQRVIESEFGVDFISVGQAVKKCKVRIADDHDVPLEDDHVGHIQIKGDNVTNGYYNNAIASDKLFTADGWLRTGDLGFIRMQNLWITGRTKNLIIINGQNYYPHDIEDVLQMNGVAELGKVVVAGIRNEDDLTEQILVFLLHKENIDSFMPILQHAQNILQEKIGLLAHHVIPVRKIPKTSSGKVQRFILVEEYAEGKYNQLLHEIAKKIKSSLDSSHFLGTREKLAHLIKSYSLDTLFNSDDTFYDIGLNSLQMTHLTLKIQEELCAHITIHDLLNFPSLDLLVDRIAILQEQNPTVVDNVPHDTWFELSAAQKRFWFLEKVFPKTKACNLVFANRINGTIDLNALQQAVEYLVKTQPGLRSRFAMMEETPVQASVTFNEMKDYFEYADLRDEGKNETEINKRIDKAAGFKMNLFDDSLFKIKVWRTNDDEYIFLLLVHHIIFDGWSFELFCHDLKTKYQLLKVNTSLIPSPEDQGVRLYVRNQNDFLKSSKSLSAKTYWLNELSGKLSVLNLPIAKQRSIATRSFRSSQVRLVLSEPIVNGIRKLSKERQVTPFVFLISIIKVLLYKYTSQHDIIIGTDLSGRSDYRFGKTYGHFLNTVLIRSKISENDSFIELLNQVKMKLNLAFENQDYPLESILEDIEVDHHPMQFPLLDVFVLFQNFDNNGKLIVFEEDAMFTHLETEASESFFDLLFEFNRIAGDWELKIVYNTDIYSDADIRRLTKHFEKLTSEVVKIPSGKISCFEFIPLSEQMELLQWSNGPLQTLPSEETVISKFQKIAMESPDSLAIVFEEKRLSYKFLENQSNALASYLRRKYSVKFGDVIAIILPRSEWSVIGLVSILKSGGVYLPIDPDYPLHRIESLLVQAAAKFIITSEAFVEKISSLGYQIELVGNEYFSEEVYDFPLKTESLACLFYTSGSTGIPKGVAISHYALLDYVYSFSNYFEISASDRIVHQSLISFDISIEEIFPALVNGATILIAPKGGFDVEFPDFLIKNKATVLSSTPNILKELNMSGRIATTLRLIVSGGERLHGSNINNLLNQVPVVANTYGPTEVTVCATFAKIALQDEAASLGKPIVNKSVLILNKDLKLVPVGMIGEIYVGGNGLALGYLNNPEDTHKSFTQNPYSVGQRLYKTGDLGKWEANGTITFCGRLDDQLKIKGFRVELEELRSHVLANPLITDVEILSLVDGDGSLYLAACYQTTINVTPDQFREHLAARIPFYIIPSVIIQVNHFPVLENSKKDLKALENLVKRERIERENSRDHLAATNEDEIKLINIWQSLLNAQPIRVHDNFFELGGNSLKATQLISRIHKGFDVSLDLKSIYLNPTVHLLVKCIKQSKRISFLPILPIEDQDYYHVSHAQKRLFFLEQFDNNLTSSNLSWAFELTGELDVTSLSSSFQYLMEKHASLRTTFFAMNDGIYQKINQVGDLGRYFQILHYKEMKISIAEFIQIDSTKPFNLKDGPLVRVSLIRIDALNSVLVISLHHLITDAWSMNIFLEDINSAYAEFANKMSPINQLSKIQYKDFTAWEHRQLECESDTYKRYWQSIVTDFKHSLSLSESNNKSLEDQGSFIRIPIEDEVGLGINQLMVKHSWTLHAQLMSWLAIHYWHSSSQTNFIVGTVAAGRTHSDTEQVVGFFVNTLPIHIRIDGGISYKELIAGISLKVAEALENQFYPFDLIQELSPSKNRTLIRTIVSELGTWQVNTGIEFKNVKAKYIGTEFKWRFDFDLTCGIQKIDEKLDLVILYKQSAFSKQQVESLGKSLIQIGRYITRDENISISRIRDRSTFGTKLEDLTGDGLELLLDQFPQS